MTWTDERVALLKARWAEGKSASAIADELGGVTRCAVIAKLHRLGLTKSHSPSSAYGSVLTNVPAAQPYHRGAYARRS